jgi:hypothetical protein
LVCIEKVYKLALSIQTKPKKMETLQALKTQLENLYNEMPRNFFEQSQRDKSAFLISREIERLENPKSYEENKSHWEGHEIRF